jgi:hypothetical protein
VDDLTVGYREREAPGAEMNTEELGETVKSQRRARSIRAMES